MNGCTYVNVVVVVADDQCDLDEQTALLDSDHDELDEGEFLAVFGVTHVIVYDKYESYTYIRVISQKQRIRDEHYIVSCSARV